MPASDHALVAFSDLRTAAYCPRKCYYRRRDRGDGADEDDRDPDHGSISSLRTLAFRYDDLLVATDAALAAEPIAVDPETYRRSLADARDRFSSGRADSDGDDGDDGDGDDGDADCDSSDHRGDRSRWDELCNPADRNVLVSGRDCRGVVHKVLEDPLAPSLISTGSPPDQGVWEPQTVHAVAAAKALSWERQTPVDAAYLEYPRHGVVRRLSLTTRRKALYRRALRTVRGIDGPPARVTNHSKCASCEYAGECGVRTRTLRSLLGFR